MCPGAAAPRLMGYGVGLGLQNPELKNIISIRHSVAEMSKSGKSTTLETTFVLFSSILSKSVADMAANDI